MPKPASPTNISTRYPQRTRTPQYPFHKVPVDAPLTFEAAEVLVLLCMWHDLLSYPEGLTDIHSLKLIKASYPAIAESSVDVLRFQHRGAYR